MTVEHMANELVLATFTYHRLVYQLYQQQKSQKGRNSHIYHVLARNPLNLLSKPRLKSAYQKLVRSIIFYYNIYIFNYNY